jgi:cyanuric acid amidohydrolase
MRINAHKIFTSSPGDITELEKLIATGVVNPSEVICIVGKTEGNGGRNDFTRDLAMRSFERLFSGLLNIPVEEVQDRIIFSLSGGTEGVVSPHIIVFTQTGGILENKMSEKRLVVGTAYTREFLPHEIGRKEQIDETARVVTELMNSLKLVPQDVHLVQMKGAIPKCSYEEQVQSEKTSRPIRSNMVYSRGASALGVAVALNELPDGVAVTDDHVCHDWSLYSTIASTSAKPGLNRTEIMLFGNSYYSTSDLVIGHGVVRDLIDSVGIKDVLTQLGFEFDVQLSPEQSSRIIGVFAKSEADERGWIRGHRHTMLTDDDISDTRYSRCVLAAVISSILGDTSVYVSTRAEHHGPQGGGNLAIIKKV